MVSREAKGGKRGRAVLVGKKKLSSVNQITLVTLCPGQTQQPNYPYLKTQTMQTTVKKQKKTPVITLQSHNTKPSLALVIDWISSLTKLLLNTVGHSTLLLEH